MKRLLITICLIAPLPAIGCMVRVQPPPVGEYLPLSAATVGIASSVSTTPTPSPPEGPKICADCNGKGWNGDGTHRFKCEPCDGRGWLDTAGTPLDSITERLTEIEQRLEPQHQPAEPEKSPHYHDQFEADFLRAQMLGRPLLVFVWHPDDTDRNKRIEQACESIEGFRDRFAFATTEPFVPWSDSTTVAEQFGLPADRTSLVIVSPSRQFVRVKSLEDLK